MKRLRSVILCICGGLTLASAVLAQAEAPQFLDQGWSDATRDSFYFTPQGSRIIPYAWFKALEQSDGSGLFSDSDNLARYGLIPADGPSALNPDAFPIGIAIDPGDQPDGLAHVTQAPEFAGVASTPRHIGLTCAACHTGVVTIKGQAIRIDGAPARFDVDLFFDDLVAAVTATMLDKERFARFAGRVLGPDGPMEMADLQRRFAAYQNEIAGDAALRRPVVASGFGRVDALTQIVNSIAVSAQKEPANLRAPGSPASFPALWLTSDLEFVQWNPIAASPMGRNGGEVLGAFGMTTLSGDPADWYRSTILLKQLHQLEAYVAALKPPAWDETRMGQIDRELASRGGMLFADHCAACHNMAPYRRTDPAANYFNKTFIEIGRVDYRAVGTDPAYVESLASRLVKTNAATQPLFGDQTLVPAPVFFLRTVGAVIRRAMDEAELSDADRAAMNGYRVRRDANGAAAPYTPSSFTDLKASPLAAVWATGPYLHNGSVPTVYELLSPQSERRPIFWTGGRELDLTRLGLVSDEAPDLFRFDASLPGNLNVGHTYPSQGLAPDERLAIIEFLKTQ